MRHNDGEAKEHNVLPNKSNSSTSSTHLGRLTDLQLNDLTGKRCLDK